MFTVSFLSHYCLSIFTSSKTMQQLHSSLHTRLLIQNPLLSHIPFILGGCNCEAISEQWVDDLICYCCNLSLMPPSNRHDGNIPCWKPTWTLPSGYSKWLILQRLGGSVAVFQPGLGIGNASGCGYMLPEPLISSLRTADAQRWTVGSGLGTCGVSHPGCRSFMFHMLQARRTHHIIL